MWSGVHENTLQTLGVGNDMDIAWKFSKAHGVFQAGQGVPPRTRLACGCGIADSDSEPILQISK
jgi:hypothetical protein